MKLRSSALAVVIAVATVSVLTFLPLSAEAATRIWTTEADFTAQGAGGSAPTFNGVEVVGTGNPASVQLLKDLTDWKNATPSGPPSARESASFTYAGNGVSVLFGGWENSHDDETWKYNASTNTWTKLNPSPRPVARSGAGMSYDPLEGVVVLFGGTNGVNIFTDTWEFNPALDQWSQVVPPLSPPMMQDTPLVYHAASAKHILFGMNIGTMGMETWAYDAALNTWANRAPSGSPSGRVQHAFAYHQTRARTVLFGGGTFGGGILSDTWEYNDSPPSWVPMSPANNPGARMRQAMAYRPDSSAVFLFGGFAGPAGALDDTWEYDASGAWNALSPLVKPSRRHEAGLTHDGLAGVMVLFGGSDETASLKGDTWTFGASFRSAGKYTSAVFDAGAANVDWQTLWWNKSTQPANTFLRFQLAAATNPNGPFSFVGPNCQANNYHTAPNQAVCATLDSKRYLRFLADFGTFDSSVTPVMEDVAIIYNVPPAAPYIVSTDPRHLALDVPLDKVVRVTFSEAMDTSSLAVQFLLGTPVTFTQAWSEGDSVVDLTHPGDPFSENTPYRLQISATDPDGFALVAGPAQNPFRFTTLKTYPTIVSTNPAHMAPSANKTAPIVVTFSEPMNTATLNVTITPFIELSASWNANEDIVTLSHTVWFTTCIEYTVEVAAEDKAGLSLMPSVPNPWRFTVECTDPYLLVTDPFHLEPDVAVNRPVSVKFSEAMNTDPLITRMTIDPDVGGKTFNWLEGNTRLTMTHTQAFMGCRAYRVTVTGKDTAGNSMVAGPPSAAPNPFQFITVCSNPYIVGTSPADGETDVAPTRSILIGFSIAMNEPTVLYTIVPNPGGLANNWGASQQLEILHDPFAQCTVFRVEVTDGFSQTGFPLVPGPVPNPWTFSTPCEGPQITSTDPADGAFPVAQDKVVRVTFSEPMNTGTVVATATPSLTFDKVWSGDQTVDLTHLREFDPCIQYQIEITGLGQDGNTLAPGPIPNPWRFTIVCTSPQIVSTSPIHGATNVPLNASITVRFTEPMNVSTVTVGTVPAIGLNGTWSDNDQTLLLTHATLFLPLRTYTVTVDGMDLDGNALLPGPVPNPWSFTTAAPPQLPAPGGLQVVGVPPTNVNLSWRGVPGAVQYAVHSATSRLAAWPWPVIALVTVPRYTAMGHYNDLLPHFYIVRARDNVGTESPNSTMGAKVPSTFSYGSQRSNIYWISLPYRSIYDRASAITDELGSSRVGIVAKWDAASQETILWFFFRGQWRGTDFPLAPGDGLYLGIVSSFQWVVTGTDGPVSLSFVAFPLPSANVNWISLPYTATYARASDVVLDIAGSLGPGANTRIVEIGKWDPLTDTMITFYWSPSGWTGSDFPLAVGEGVYLRVVGNFSWTPRLVTPEVP